MIDIMHQLRKVVIETAARLLLVGTMIACSSDSAVEDTRQNDSAMDAIRGARGDRDSTQFEDPVELIREYARRDAAGDRLQRSAWFSAVATWEDEPAWDEFTIVHDYAIEAERVGSDSAFVRISYDRLGYGTGSGGGRLWFRSDPARDTVVFVLVRAERYWKIDWPQVNPHVSVPATLAIEAFADSSRRALEQLVRSRP